MQRHSEAGKTANHEQCMNCENDHLMIKTIKQNADNQIKSDYCEQKLGTVNHLCNQSSRKSTVGKCFFRRKCDDKNQKLNFGVLNSTFVTVINKEHEDGTES